MRAGRLLFLYEMFFKQFHGASRVVAWMAIPPLPERINEKKE